MLKLLLRARSHHILPYLTYPRYVLIWMMKAIQRGRTALTSLQSMVVFQRYYSHWIVKVSNRFGKSWANSIQCKLMSISR